jgi:hypothetical protein
MIKYLQIVVKQPSQQFFDECTCGTFPLTPVQRVPWSDLKIWVDKAPN